MCCTRTNTDFKEVIAQLGKFNNVVNERLSLNHPVLVIFVEFNNTFDILSERKPFETLSEIGIRGQLSHYRSIMVKLSKTLSKKNLWSMVSSYDYVKAIGSLLMQTI